MDSKEPSSPRDVPEEPSSPRDVPEEPSPPRDVLEEPSPPRDVPGDVTLKFQEGLLIVLVPFWGVLDFKKDSQQTWEVLEISKSYILNICVFITLYQT